MSSVHMSACSAQSTVERDGYSVDIAIEVTALADAPPAATDVVIFEASDDDSLYRFGVPKPLLEQNSSALAHMLRLAHPNEGVDYKGVPVVRIHDEGATAEAFFQFLTDPSVNVLRSLDTVRAERIYHIADKYAYEHVLDMLRPWLSLNWPVTLEQWDLYLEGVADADPCAEFSHTPSIVTAATAVKLARNLGIHDIIPYALYMINAQCGALDCDDVLEHLVAAGLLTEPDVDSITSGRIKFLEVFSNESDRNKTQLLECCGSAQCTSREHEVRHRVNDVLTRRGMYDPLHSAHMVFDINAEWSDSPVLALCGVCRSRWAIWARYIRAKIWECVPVFFAV